MAGFLPLRIGSGRSGRARGCALFLTACGIGASTVPAYGDGYCNPASIQMVDGTAASPYPSTITVNGLLGPVFHVTVTLMDVNASFQFPSGYLTDMDFLLVGPQGQAVVLMSDIGCPAVGCPTPLTFTFDDRADGPLPCLYAMSGGGTYKPTNCNDGTNDTFPPPAPSVGPGIALSVFNGTNPNGTWSLYAVDDQANGDSGRVGGGWCLNINDLYCNAASITIPRPGFTAGNASPYPSQISLSGLPFAVGRLDVLFRGLSHAFPDDVDTLLEHSGRNVLLM